jgi:hypothetical protein
MKKAIILSIVAMVLGAVVVSIAEEAAAPEVTVKGTVVVTKEGDAVAKIVIKKAEGAAVNVALDDEGKKLAAMDGKAVEAKGVMKEEKLVVKSCKAVEEKKAE